MSPSSGFSFGTSAEREPPIQAMCDNGDKVANVCESSLYSLRESMFGLDFNCDGLLAEYTRTVYTAGSPLAPTTDCRMQDWHAMDVNAAAVLTSLYDIKASVESDNSDITMYFVYPQNTGLTFDYYLNKDLQKLSLSFGCVFGVVWYMSSSLFPTICGLLNIVISFPLGLFVWVIVLGEPGITYLMYNGIFIILGIGCDDVFVLLDAFRKATEQPPHISGSLETRFAWAYSRAAMAMLTTSFTTGLAFGACALSEIWDIRCFSVVNGAMVWPSIRKGRLDLTCISFLDCAHSLLTGVNNDLICCTFLFVLNFFSSSLAMCCAGFLQFLVGYYLLSRSHVAP